MVSKTSPFFLPQGKLFSTVSAARLAPECRRGCSSSRRRSSARSRACSPRRSAPGPTYAGRPDPMGKKGKAPALATEPEELKHLGVYVNDLIQTPLGVVATVAGLDVKEGVATSQPPKHPATRQPPSNPATIHPPASMPASQPPTHASRHQSRARAHPPAPIHHRQHGILAQSECLAPGSQIRPRP